MAEKIKTLRVGMTLGTQTLGKTLAGKIIRVRRLRGEVLRPTRQFRLVLVMPVSEDFHERKRELREQACAFYLRATPADNCLWTYLALVEFRSNRGGQKKVYVGGIDGEKLPYEFSWRQPTLPTPAELLRVMASIIEMLPPKKFTRWAKSQEGSGESASL